MSKISTFPQDTLLSMSKEAAQPMNVRKPSVHFAEEEEDVETDYAVNIADGAKYYHESVPTSDLTTGSELYFSSM